MENIRSVLFISALILTSFISCKHSSQETYPIECTCTNNTIKAPFQNLNQEYMIKIPNNYSGNGFITTIEGQKFGKYIQDSVNLNSGFSNFSTAISPFGENLCKPFPDSIIFSMSTKHIYLYKTDTICKNGTIEGFYYCNDVSPDSNQFFYGEVFLKTLTTDTINCFRNSLRCAYKSSYIHDVHSIVNSIKRN